MSIDEEPSAPEQSRLTRFMSRVGGQVQQAGEVVRQAGARASDTYDATRRAVAGLAAARGAGTDVAVPADPATANRLAARMTGLVRGTDWSAVARQASARPAEATAKARELLQHVDWSKVGPQTTRLALALALGAAVGDVGAAVDEGADLVTMLLAGHRDAVAAGAAADLGDEQLRAVLASPEAEALRLELEAG